MTQNVYIGPNIQKLGLIRNQVYLDGIPGHIKAAIALHPEIEALIIPLGELDDSIRKSRTKGEHLHHVYQELLNTFNA